VSIKAPREQDLVRPALEPLALRGAFAWRNNSGAVAAASTGKRRFIRFGGTPGASDILGILPGVRQAAQGRPCQPVPVAKIQSPAKRKGPAHRQSARRPCLFFRPVLLLLTHSWKVTPWGKPPSRPRSASSIPPTPRGTVCATSRAPFLAVFGLGFVVLFHSLVL
jgi:hypothetical protein